MSGVIICGAVGVFIIFFGAFVGLTILSADDADNQTKGD